jgi:hypothetical protein
VFFWHRCPLTRVITGLLDGLELLVAVSVRNPPLGQRMLLEVIAGLDTGTVFGRREPAGCVIRFRKTLLLQSLSNRCPIVVQLLLRWCGLEAAGRMNHPGFLDLSYTMVCVDSVG